MRPFRFINMENGSKASMEDTSGAIHVSERPESAIYELFDRHRLLLFLVTLIIELGIFVAGLLTPLSNSTQQSIANQTNTQFSSIPTDTPQQLLSLIYTHNLPIGLLEMVPVLGGLLFVYSIYVTGLVAQVIALSAGQPGQLGAILFLFPYSLVELSGYAISVGSGIMLLISWRRGRLGRELRVFVLEMAGVALVLFVAAAMETVTKFSPIIGLALWVPTGLAVAGIVVYSGRRHE